MATAPLAVSDARAVGRTGERMPWIRLSWLAVAVCVISLALTAGLSVIAHEVDQHSEHRLLTLQVKQTATVLQAVLPSVETPLASAAQIAETGNGSVAAFRTYTAPYIGPSPKPFVGMSLWRLDGASAPELVATAGQSALLAGEHARLTRTLLAATKQPAVQLTGPLGLARPRPRLGYTYAVRSYVVYAESLLPARRHVAIERGSPFSNLRFALYLGKTMAPSALLETNVGRLPLGGDTATATVPFGASSLTLTGASTRRLGGGLSGALWWIIVLVGIVLSLLAAGMTERLVRARRAAERDTALTSVLLAEERTIAQTLQQALLPETLPAIPGLRSQARYVTGTAGVDIGGDWYDLLPVDHDRVYFVVGDVSGRGVRAGTTMAALRFAIHAFVYEGHPPAVVLDRLTRMIDVGRDGQFATVLCGVLDVSRREVTLASAGHLPPLVIGAQATYVDVPTGPPVGVRTPRRYESVTVSVPPRATLLAFTDGLVERPDEALDASLERLRAEIATAASLEAVFEQLGSSGGADDIAILGVQWTT